MITRIEGRLTAVHAGRVELESPPLVYELLVPAGDVQSLNSDVGNTVRFHTLHYMEAQGQGTSFIPRLIGFRTPADRAFFELFTTVKGMGNRKALRALELPFTRIAAAIATRDVDLLVSLPEIGKRTAETIVAELNGKVDKFTGDAAIELKPSAGGATDSAQMDIARDAIAVLTMLGESKTDATKMVNAALATEPDLATADAVVETAYRLRGAK